MPLFKRKSVTSKTKAEPPPPISVSTKPGENTLRHVPSNSSDRGPLTPNSLNGDIGVPEQVLAGQGGQGTGRGRPANLLLRANEETGSGASFQGPASPMRTSSRLSKTLREILHDQNGVTCFLHYMKSVRAGHLIQFWLDAESFHVSTLLRIRTHSLNSSVSGEETTVSGEETRKEGATTPELAQSLQEEFVVGGSTADASIVTSRVESSPDRDHVVEEPGDECDTVVGGAKLVGASPSESEAVRQCDPSADPRSHSEDVKSAEVGSKWEGGEQTEQPDVAAVLSTGLSKQDIRQKVRKSIQHDAVTIFTKYISQDATLPIGISEHLRSETVHRICQENGQVDPECFTDCQEFVFHRMGTENYKGFLDSEFHCKHQVDVLTTGKVYLGDILYNELALSYFMEFMDNEGACHLLQFWLAADNFQQHLASQGHSYNGIQAQEDAMVLYDKYFSLQASQPLGFDDQIRFLVEGNICRENGPLPDCFAKPRDIVLNTIEKNYFPDYLQSDMYYKFLSDLVSTVQTAQDIPVKPTHRRTESDASSEHSAGSQNMSESIRNTLLAMDTRHLKKAFTRLEEDLRLDTMLLNPDALWQRPDTSSMMLGKMDNLGQFQSWLDPEPDHEKKKASRFFKKKKDKEKEQEDMALRVAQMIINDVTTMTQTGDMYVGVSPAPQAQSNSQQESAIATSKGDHS